MIILPRTYATVPRNIRFYTITALMAVSSAVTAQDDLLIYRNGGEKAVRIIMVSGSEVTYSEYAKSGPEQKESLRDIYMLRYSKRGNVYITDDCKRITGENRKNDIYITTTLLADMQWYRHNIGSSEIWSDAGYIEIYQLRDTTRFTVQPWLNGKVYGLQVQS